MLPVNMMKNMTWMKAGVAMVAMSWSGLAFAGGEGWVSDFSAAKKQAADANEDLLVDFTGSDWCGWCIKLNEEVFSHDEFKDGVKDKFVLVELDFPRDKSKLSEETQKQNAELGKAYGVRGYPTILLCDASGKPYAATGYQKGGPEAYVKHLDELRGKKAARDKAFASAEEAEGVEKAESLVAALTAMDLTDAMVANFYGDVAEQIKASDPDDKTGFTKAAEDKAKAAAFDSKLRGFAQNKDFDGAIAFVDTALSEGDLGAEQKQQLLLTKASFLAQQGKFDDAIKMVDEGKAASPESPMASAIDGFRKQLESAKEKAAAE